MKEFIKIKNVDGSGEMLLRVALILSVMDGDIDLAGEAGTVVKYRDESDGSYWQYRTASTAAEVLGAIEGQGAPTGLVFKSCTCAGTLSSDPDCVLHGRNGLFARGGGASVSYRIAETRASAHGEVVRPNAFKPCSCVAGLGVDSACPHHGNA